MRYIQLLSLILLVNCTNNDIYNNCKPDFFEKNSNMFSLNEIFIIDSTITIENQYCGYVHKFDFWLGWPIKNKHVPYISYKGYMYMKDKVIYLQTKDNGTIKYFDFNLALFESCPVKYRFKTINIKGDSIYVDKIYNLKLLNRFYDSLAKDTIYKFCFEKINLDYEDDLVFFVGIKIGVKGIYQGMILNGTCVQVYSYKGEIYEDFKRKSNLLLK